jgi:ElaB/YqjD/DUF883 family membrane-anchored ribosome-binding protein
MNTFMSMSNLVADAEDLLAKLGNSTSPEIRALKNKLERSILEMKEEFRLRVKKSSGHTEDFTQSVVSFWQRNAMIPVIAAATAVVIGYAMLVQRNRS